MKKILSSLLAIGITSFSLTAAAAYNCTGTVDMLDISPSGMVVASIGSMRNVYLCQIGATYNYGTRSVSSDACKMVYASLLAAKMSGTQETLGFDDALDCNSQHAWAPMIGWYWGPVMSN